MRFRQLIIFWQLDPQFDECIFHTQMLIRNKMILKVFFFFIFSKTLIDCSNSTLNDTMKYFSLLKKIMHLCLTDCHNSRNGNFDSFCYQTQFKSYTLLTRCKWTNLIKSVKAVGTFRQLIPFIILTLRLIRVSHKDEC